MSPHVHKNGADAISFHYPPPQSRTRISGSSGFSVLRLFLGTLSPQDQEKRRGGSGEKRIVPSRPHVNSGPDPAIYSRVRSQGGPACPENSFKSRAPADGLRRGLVLDVGWVGLGVPNAEGSPKHDESRLGTQFCVWGAPPNRDSSRLGSRLPHQQRRKPWGVR